MRPWKLLLLSTSVVLGSSERDADAQIAKSPWGVATVDPPTATTSLGLPTSVANPNKPTAACTAMYQCAGQPTPQQCQDPCWLKVCSGGNPLVGPTCRAVLLPIFKQNVAQISLTKPLVAPPSFPKAGQRLTTKRVMFDAKRMTTAGMTGTLAGDQAAARDAYVPRSTTSTPAATAAAAKKTEFEAKRTRWNTNGAVVGSCEEFVHEKFFSYSAFLDDVGRAAGAPRRVVELAYSPAHALSTKPNVLNKQGAPAVEKGQTIKFGLPGGTRPKNAFVGALPATTMTLAYPLNKPANLPANCQPHVMSAATFGPAGRVDALRGKTFGRTYVNHNATNFGLTGLGWNDEDLELRYRKQQELKALLSRRARINVATLSGAPDVPDPSYTPNPASYNMYNQQVFCGLAAIDREIEDAFREARDLGCYETGLSSCDWSPQEFVDELLSDDSRAAVERARQLAFTECSDLTNGTGLLWTPVAEVTDVVATKNSAGASTAGLAANWIDFKKSVAAFDQFRSLSRTFLAQAVEDKKLAKVEAQVSDPDRAGKKALGRDWTDSGSIGGDLFGGRYEAKAGWSVGNFQFSTPSSAQLCATKVRAWAGLDARGTVLGQEIPIAFFSGRANLSQVTSSTQANPTATFTTALDARVLGVTMWAGQYAKTFPTSFSLVATPAHVLRSPKIGSSFPVAGVPVTVGGYAAGRVGVTIALSGSGRANCGADLRSELDFRFDGRLEPTAQIEGIAEVSLGVPGLLEAGVRGRLTLVRASVPFVTNARALWVEGKSSTRFQAGQNLDFELGTLDGRLSLYLSSLGEDVAEEDLFTWEGFVHRTKLMALDYDVGLKNAAVALY